MSKRFKPTLQQRIEATRFVAYELWMLRECAQMPKPAGRVARNMWYEVLVLHTRVLRDFFFTKHNDDGKRVTHDRDIVAVDYFTLTTSSWHSRAKTQRRKEHRLGAFAALREAQVFLFRSVTLGVLTT